MFEPLGMLNSVFTEMKDLFQELCQSKLGWDDPLLYRKLQRWYDELRKVGYIEIPRHFLNNNSDGPVSYQLHEFCESSSVCYAAVVYLSVETEVRTSSVKDKSSSTFQNFTTKTWTVFCFDSCTVNGKGCIGV